MCDAYWWRHNEKKGFFFKACVFLKNRFISFTRLCCYWLHFFSLLLKVQGKIKKMRNIEIETLRSRLSQRKPRRRRSRSPSGGSYVVKTSSRRSSHRVKKHKTKRKPKGGKTGKGRKQKSIYGGIRINNVSGRRQRRRRKTSDTDESDDDHDDIQNESSQAELTKKKKNKRQGKNKRSSYNQEDSEEYLPEHSPEENEEYEQDYEM